MRWCTQNVKEFQNFTFSFFPPPPIFICNLCGGVFSWKETKAEQKDEKLKVFILGLGI